MDKLLVLSLILAYLVAAVSCLEAPAEVKPDQIRFSTILPKLQAIHEDAHTLLIKNSELKSRILAGLQAQNEEKLKQAKELRMTNNASSKVAMTPTSTPAPSQPIQATLPAARPQPSVVPSHSAHPQLPQGQDGDKEVIDYAELEEFNKWVDSNLEYAVKNTQATLEALKEEASLNNGVVDYSEQAINDGIEGVKYWQSAVIFQDKTLNNEKFEIE